MLAIVQQLVNGIAQTRGTNQMKRFSLITTTAVVIAFVIMLSLALDAEASRRKPTPLGLWIQSIQHTERAERMGCNIAPPYSTLCWEHVVSRSGRIVRTVYYTQPPKGWTAK